MNNLSFYPSFWCFAPLFLFGTLFSFSQCAPDFGAASHFALFTSAGAVSNVATSSVQGDIGTDAGAITGFDYPTVFNGTFHTADTQTSAAAADLLSAYTLLAAFAPTNSLHTPVFGNGESLMPGVYFIGGAASVANTLTLDGGGNPEAIFIFSIGGALTTGAGATVVVTNGTLLSNVFWIVDGAIALAAGSTMCGTLISNNSTVSVGDQCSIQGRLYSTAGAISIYGSSVSNIDVDSKAIGGSISPDQNISCIYDLLDLTVAGSSGSVVKWQKANDYAFSVPIDIANTSTTLSSTSLGDLTETTYFRAVIQKIGCDTTLAYSVPSTQTFLATSWNGMSWDNGLPSELKAVIIPHDYTSTGSVTALCVMVQDGAHVLLSAGDTLTVVNSLTVDAGSFFTVSDQANLIQISDRANGGVISVQKDTALLKRLDYVFWSSPVAGQLLLPYSPLTLPDRFYNYNSATNFYDPIFTPATTYFEASQPVLIRMPNNHPTLPTVWHGTFTGVPNNGLQSIAVTNGTYTGLGNPYPSGINTNAFIAANGITEALYFWRKTNNQYNTSYAVYTTAGGTSNIQGDPLHLAPGSILSIGQGFIAKTTTSTILFTNAMRTAAVAVPLLKSDMDASRLWLDLSSLDGYFSQILIAYMPNATLGVDAAIEGRFFNDSSTALTSIVGNELFTIQGRPLPFTTDDIVPLSFQCDMSNTFTIALPYSDGLFAAGQEVYLLDNTNGVLTNLSQSNYTFTSLAGVFNTRFELRYQVPLSSPEVEEVAPIVICNQGSNFLIQSRKELITALKVFDVTGQLLVEKENISNLEYLLTLDSKDNVYLIQVTTSPQHRYTLKAIH